jgi:cytochrome P450
LRTLRKPLELGEYSLPAGLSLAASPALTHYDPTLYPDPFAFRPDRFLTFQPRPWEYYPFGGGVRRCIGASFATHEMAQVLAALLLSYRFDLQDSTPPRPERRSVTMAPRGGVPARCSRRPPGG